MTKQDILDALVQQKRIGGLFDEVLDLSKQLAEAVDRSDEVTMRMLISMRAEPIEKLKLADQILKTQVSSFENPEDAERLSAILRGAEAEDPSEELLVKQVSSNLRMHKRIMELDRMLSRKIARDRSVYSK